MTTRTRVYLYFATLTLFALAMTGSGVMDLMRPPAFIEGLAHLGYPAYLALLLGTWKLLGVAAIVVARYPRLKEWAYAGFTFELTGAAFSHLASGEGLGNAMAPLVLCALGLVSYALRTQGRKLPDIA